mmetsp:Transcript_3823/g.11020  ORF Transcript_3823/g.11020 Transcript_3823/m.11020 type:complete len:1228 (+) Transcript_3823:338-4021(+)
MSALSSAAGLVPTPLAALPGIRHGPQHRAGRPFRAAIVYAGRGGKKGGGKGRSGRGPRGGRGSGAAAVPGSLDSPKAVKSRKAARAEVAARITAAKALAQRLAQEKAAAASAARAALASGGLNQLEAETQRAVDDVVDAAEAAVGTVPERGAAGVSRAEIQRMQAENKALQALVQQQAEGSRAARQRLKRLKERYAQLAIAERAAGPGTDSSGPAREAAATTGSAPGPSAPVLASASVEPDASELAALLEGLASDQQSAATAGMSSTASGSTSSGSGSATAGVGSSSSSSGGRNPGNLEEARKKLRAAAEAAERRGEAVFAYPTNAVVAGQRTQVYYNRLWGPARSGRGINIKAGFNDWSHIVEEPFRKETALDGLPNSDWWVGSLEAPQQLYALEFVFLDPATGTTDNNRQKNYKMALEGATTKEAIAAEREAACHAAESKRLQELEESEAKLWGEVLVAADREADVARAKCRDAAAAAVAEEAAKVASERRGDALAGFTLQEGIPGVFSWSPSPPPAGKASTLLYNKAHGPLSGARDVVAHWGYDGWWQEDITHAPLAQLPPEEAEKMGLPRDGEWWGVDVDLPSTVATVDFVLSDSDERMWDNNGRADFHSSVGSALHAAALETKLASLLRAPEEEEEEAVELAAKRAHERVLARARAQRRRREVQRTMLYTDPVTPRAGQTVTVYYNPDATVLRGRPEVWLRGSWNRWNHPECYMPRRMTPADPSGNLGFLKATVDVPPDAQVMDLVFSDTGDLHGGFYDNNGGLDYHIVCTGGTGQSPLLKIVHVTVEMAPIAKVGGMGDVVTALGRAVQEEGHDVSVILPKYDVLRYGAIRDLTQGRDFWYEGVHTRAWHGIVEDLKTVFLEPQNGIFWVGCVYGRNDDAGRFNWFCGAAAEYIRTDDTKPDVVHCHDWPTAPVTWAQLDGARTVFTIHNLNYGADLIGRAMASTNVGTTVSPTYAREVSGHPAIAPHMDKFYGIINGIDQDIWDPQQDEYLPRNYGPDDVTEGKAAAKAELRRRFGLSTEDVPLAAVVTRLTHQKGTHLIKHAAWRTLERGAQFVLLGSAPDPRVQGEFNQLAGDLSGQYGNRARLHFEYDEPLSHLIYAAADILLVPSMFEPCGLTQMIAMRYGTVPVVRRTGGLADTVYDVDDDRDKAASAGHIPNGFSFEGTDSNALDYALNRALTMCYSDKKEWADLTERIMQQDWSWDSPALDYTDAYHLALKKL